MTDGLASDGLSIAPGQLRWRCRRGMKELDVLLNRYLDEQYPAASSARQASFRELLELQDPAIYAYCMGREPAPSAELAALVDALIGTAPNDR